jgi:hypothetical protein
LAVIGGLLDIGRAARLARASEQGFDVDQVLYHGTSKDFEKFDRGQLGSLTDARSAKRAIWFSDDPVTANAYANFSATHGPVKKLIDEATAAERRRDFDTYEKKIIEAEDLESKLTRERRAGQNVIPVFAKADLFDVDMQGRSFDDFGVSDEIDEILRSAQKDGRSGVRFRNLNDAVGLADRPATHVAVFKENDIRSVNAVFDPEKKSSPNLLSSPAPIGVAAGLLAANQSPELKDQAVALGEVGRQAITNLLAPTAAAPAALIQALTSDRPTEQIRSSYNTLVESQTYKPQTDLGKQYSGQAIKALGGAMAAPLAAGASLLEPLQPVADLASEYIPDRAKLVGQSLLDIF